MPGVRDGASGSCFCGYDAGMKMMVEHPVIRPRSVEELAASVGQVAAGGGGGRVRVAGSGSLPMTGFSEDGGAIQTVSMMKMGKILEHAVGDMTVTVQA